MGYKSTGKHRPLIINIVLGIVFIIFVIGAKYPGIAGFSGWIFSVIDSLLFVATKAGYVMVFLYAAALIILNTAAFGKVRAGEKCGALLFFGGIGALIAERLYGSEEAESIHTAASVMLWLLVIFPAAVFIMCRLDYFWFPYV